MKILVTGGVRSGKSRHAESLLADASEVRYIAPGPIQDDADWQARVSAHRSRRPATWATHESGDLLTGFATSDPVLLDCLGTWLTRYVDDANLVTARRWCWRQSAQSATGPATTEAMITVEALHPTAADAVSNAIDDLISLISAYQPAAAARTTLRP